MFKLSPAVAIASLEAGLIKGAIEPSTVQHLFAAAAVGAGLGAAALAAYLVKREFDRRTNERAWAANPHITWPNPKL